MKIVSRGIIRDEKEKPQRSREKIRRLKREVYSNKSFGKASKK